MEFLFLAHMLYSIECCSERDCHPVPCNEIVDLGTGWQWRRTVFSRAMLHTSPDGGCHVCIFENWYEGICIYLPVSS